MEPTTNVIEKNEALGRLKNRAAQAAWRVHPKEGGEPMSKKDIERTKLEIEQAFESIHGRLRKIESTLAMIREQGDIEVPSRGERESYDAVRC